MLAKLIALFISIPVISPLVSCMSMDGIENKDFIDFSLLTDPDSSEFQEIIEKILSPKNIEIQANFVEYLLNSEATEMNHALLAACKLFKIKSFESITRFTDASLFKTLSNAYVQYKNSGIFIHCLAFCHECGIGTKLNPTIAELLYTKGMDKKSSFSFFNLATIYANGTETIKQDIKKAFDLYTKAIELNNSAAMNCLALIYKNGTGGINIDTKKAIDLLEKAIKLNDSSAMIDLALIYHNGTCGINQDINKAIQLYTKASKLNNSTAMHNLAHIYLHGTGGIKKDRTLAIQLFDKAIELNNPFALKNSSTIYNGVALIYQNGIDGTKKDIKKAIELFEKAIKLNDSIAMSNLGYIYANGTGGIKIDINKAIDLYTQAIKLNDSTAMYNLVCTYVNGIGGIKKNIPLAIELFDKAIELKDSSALKSSPAMYNNVALIYKNGTDGTKKDIKKAIQLFEKAIKLNSSEAMYNLACIYEHGTEDTEKDIKKAIDLYTQAIELNNSAAMNNLALMYANGLQGVEKDIKQAIELFKKAIKLNSSKAMNNLAFLYITDTKGNKKMIKKAIQLFEKAIKLNNSSAKCNLDYILQIERNSKKTSQPKLSKKNPPKKQIKRKENLQSSFSKTAFISSTQEQMTVDSWYKKMDENKSFQNSQDYINRVTEWEKREEKNMSEEASQKLKNCLNKHSGHYYKLIEMRNNPSSEDLNADQFSKLTKKYENSLLKLSRQCETFLPVIESKKPEILPGDQKNKKNKKNKIKKSNDIYDDSFENKEDPKEKYTPQENKEDCDTDNGLTAEWVKGDTDIVGLWTWAISNKLENLEKNLEGGFLLKPEFLKALRRCSQLHELSGKMDKRLEFETLNWTKSLSRSLLTGEKLCSVRINDSSDAKRLVFIIKTKETLENAIDVKSFKFVDYHN